MLIILKGVIILDNNQACNQIMFYGKYKKSAK